VPLALARRARRGKEDPARSGERYGLASAPRPSGRVVWVHAASVGETNAVMPLVDRLVATGCSVVFTSVTITSAAIAARRLPAGAVHQFSPLDIGSWIGRFLDHWRPDLALFVESELWPATILALAARGIPQLLMNARLSERSQKGWGRFGTVSRALFSRITACLAQSAKDGERYRALGVPQTIVTGNLKFDVPPPPADPAALATFRTAVGGRPLWVAASTHEGEEEIVAAAHRILKTRFPDVLTVIAPRHPPRGPAIRTLLAGQGFTVAERSLGEPLTAATDIYLADTLGELGLFYRAAPVALLGGSLIAHGGQNPIEPARLDTALLHGPFVHNFEDIYAALDRNGGAVRVSDAASLAAAVGELLSDKSALARRRRSAATTLEPFSGALEATMRALTPWLQSADAAVRRA
jgi:3-deoxy-D-manno-octulosonic-acid transferase